MAEERTMRAARSAAEDLWIAHGHRDAQDASAFVNVPPLDLSLAVMINHSDWTTFNPKSAFIYDHEENSSLLGRRVCEGFWVVLPGLSLVNMNSKCVMRTTHATVVAAGTIRPRPPTAAAAAPPQDRALRPMSYGYGDTAAACSSAPMTVSLALPGDASAARRARGRSTRPRRRRVRVLVRARRLRAGIVALLVQARRRGLWFLGDRRHWLGEAKGHGHLPWISSLSGAGTTSGSEAGTGSEGGAGSSGVQEAPQKKAVSGRDAAGCRSDLEEAGLHHDQAKVLTKNFARMMPDAVSFRPSIDEPATPAGTWRFINIPRGLLPTFIGKTG
ncbi:hypothetical protein FB451DRAFT_1376711 [Mycena latifolia]|nr:hypothetical protein FB451DRAFT_1376711 [Mycena latifolia]